jgi:glucose-1-phosphate cytidylyltransferase
MKVVILCGGLGTRISEESHLKPKPMIEIGDYPILWHIMKTYAHFGFNDFILCVGYKGHVIKEYFNNYFLHASDVTIDFKNPDHKIIHNHSAEPWTITLVNTGLDTMTGGRVKKIQKYVNNEPFMLTYGDGVSDVNIKELVDYHLNHKKLMTVTAIQPMGRFGILDIDDDCQVNGFREKPAEDGIWINGGFFVCQPEIFKYIENDQTLLEQGPIQGLARDGQLKAYQHKGFWHPMDTLRDKNHLEQLWKSGKAPWKIWS